ncbi:MAG: RebB family R body protein [Myxococcota bacterium]
MADSYDHAAHQHSIQERKDALSIGVDLGAEESEQVRRRLNEIALGVSEINSELQEVRDRLPRDRLRAPTSRPRTDLGQALAEGLRRDAGVPESDANSAGRNAADRIKDFARDNDSDMTDRELANVVRGIDPDGINNSDDYGDAVYNAVKDAVLEPGRDLPHHMRNLEEARDILAAAGSPSGGRRSSPCDKPNEPDLPTLAAPPPSGASSEVLRDVSHLTTLLLGSSPAFAEAMRFQSDAVAYSLAALNKVSDMQRQDALGLAITARAAATKFENS